MMKYYAVSIILILAQSVYNKSCYYIILLSVKRLDDL